MDRDTQATQHRREFGQDDRMTTSRAIGDLIRQFSSLPDSKKSKYSIMVGAMKYGPQEIEGLARELGVST
jgi:hypothetical protein